ncbi:hypothetical protein J3A83DRAFT_4188373 [Scleroderma citrinum]
MLLSFSFPAFPVCPIMQAQASYPTYVRFVVEPFPCICNKNCHCGACRGSWESVDDVVRESAGEVRWILPRDSSSPTRTDVCAEIDLLGCQEVWVGVESCRSLGDTGTEYVRCIAHILRRAMMDSDGDWWTTGGLAGGVIRNIEWSECSSGPETRGAENWQSDDNTMGSMDE